MQTGLAMWLFECAYGRRRVWETVQSEGAPKKWTYLLTYSILQIYVGGARSRLSSEPGGRIGPWSGPTQLTRMTYGRIDRQTEFSSLDCVGKNRPYLLQMLNYTVYFNAKRLFWARASKRSTTRSVDLLHNVPFNTADYKCACIRKLQGGTRPSAACLATPLYCRFITFSSTCWILSVYFASNKLLYLLT